MNAETLKSTNWTTIAEIENSGEISCIDGRHSHCVVGAPGGNIGEMILMLSAAERLNDDIFTPEQLEQLLANYASTFGRFYMHTDSHAVQQLMKSLTRDNFFHSWLSKFDGDTQAFFNGLLELDKQHADRVLQYLLMPKHVGCGHLKLLIQESDNYQVRPQLVLNTVASFFSLDVDGEQTHALGNARRRSL